MTAAGPLPASLVAPEPVYGGFWRRFGALFIDGILLNVVMSPIVMLMFVPSISRFDPHDLEQMSPDTLGAVLGAYGSMMCLGGVVDWLYSALLQCSSRQATVGMMALGLRMTDLGGRRIGFGRATGRWFARILTGLTLLIGYLMMLFTRRRQTLHDLMAGTLVLRS